MFMPSLKCFAFLLVGLFAFSNILNALSSPVEVLLEVVAIQLKTTLPVKESREQRADAKEVIATNFPTPEESKVVNSSTNTPTSSPKPVKPIFLNIPDQLFTNETDYVNRPIITDIFSTPKNGSMIIYAVYSALNLRSKQADVSSNNFTLVHGNTSVKNLIGVKAHVEALRDLKFILPYEVTESFYVDIIDYKRQFTYKHLFVEILREEKVGGIGVCAMVSDFNSIGEVKNWISWYKFQQLSNVMLYSIKPVPHIEKEIYPAISKGFVKYYQYQYPLNKYRQNKEQRSIQLAVINSCFFRHKHLYDGMLMIDVDEFVYSPTHPRDLQQALMNLLQHSRMDMFLFRSTMCYLAPPANRTRSFEEGTIFSDYIWKEPSGFSGRPKYLLRSTSDGSLTTHYCVQCSWSGYVSEKKVMINHYKDRHKNKTALTLEDSMKELTPLFQEEMKNLMG